MSMFDDDGPPSITVPGCPLKVKYVDSMGIPRAFDDRPIIRRPCPDARLALHLPSHQPCVNGRVPGTRAGGKKCPTCKGNGELWKAYARTTSYISALESTDNVAKWRVRNLLRGMALEAVDTHIVGELLTIDWDTFDTQETKRTLNALADRLMVAGGVETASDRGTHIHKLTEAVDRGLPLPAFTSVPDKGLTFEVTLQDRADVAAWRRVLDDLDAEVLAVEKFVVLDELCVAGTADRLLHLKGRSICDQCDLPVIGDLKTGSVEYGGGKMPQQLAIYSRAVTYDPATGAREAQEVCTHRGLIINLPAGSGEASCYVADLEKGWESVGLSTAVRAHRNESKKHLWPLEVAS